MTTRRHLTLRALAVLALVVPTTLLAACGDDESADSTTTTAKEAAATAPKVSDAWARQVQDNGAVYLTITGGSEADALVKASVPADVAGTAQIHETVAADSSMGSESTTTMGSETTTTMAPVGETDDMGEETTTTAAGGMMEMQPVDKVDIPAGGTVKLAPGGFHIMLLDMQQTLSPGDTIEVTLTFEHAGEQTVTAEVREA